MMTLNFLSRRLSTSSTLPFCFSGQLSRNVFCGRNNNDSSWTKMLSGVSSRGNNQNMISKTCLFIQRGEGLIFISKNSVSSSSSCFIGTKNQIINETAARNNTNNENDPEEDFTKSHVVYEGGLSGQLKRVKLFSMITSAMGMSMQPMILNSPDTHLAATIAVLSMVGFFTYGTPFLIHQLAKKYVTEIIYNPEDSTYTAVRYTFFLRRNELTFTRDQVVVPDVPGPFTTAVVNTKDGKKTPLFFALESFKYPEHYGLLMGYDKPLDLHITTEDVEEALKQQKEEKQSRKEK